VWFEAGRLGWPPSLTIHLSEHDAVEMSRSGGTIALHEAI
jgi:hypothetical protein